MSAHSRKPAWAASAARIDWRHCRRPNCGAKPFVPSKADPALCEDCAAEYTERGRKYCRRCDKWLPLALFRDGQGRCRPCLAAIARAWRKANPEKARGTPERQARDRARFAAWNAANPESRRERWRRYRLSEHGRAKRRDWQRERYRRDPAKHIQKVSETRKRRQLRAVRGER